MLDVYAVAASDKVATEEAIPIESSLFELTPTELVTGVVTEDGVLTPERIEAVSKGLRQLSHW